MHGLPEDCPRWRILCSLSEEAKPVQRRHLLGRLNGLLRGIASRESWTLSQSYYFGAVARNPSHQVALIDGTPIDLHDDLNECWIGPGKTETTGHTEDVVGDERETSELIRRICCGEEYHTALTPLAARLIGRNVPKDIARELMRGIMLSRPEASRDARWKARFDEIERLIDSAIAQFAADAEARDRNNKKPCAMAMELCRLRLPSTAVRQRLLAQADTFGISADRAFTIAEWAFGRSCAQRSGANA